MRTHMPTATNHTTYSMPKTTNSVKSMKATRSRRKPQPVDAAVDVSPATTAQQLGSIVKSARDTMRKDKGLNGDLDRLPMLTWIMFLKFLDDLERIDEDKAAMAGKVHKPFIKPPYRWRDWAAPEDGITGDDLIAFVNQQEATLPNGKKGKGLFTYLKSLRGDDGPDRRDTIARVFDGTVNRMINGYLLREVVNKINGIHFNSSEEIHTLSRLYESMLREMRDAAGDSGEFYTPRAVVRLMVEVTDPRIGETVLDPAAGTGGFLVEAFSHMSKQAKTVKDRETLQARTIFGGEPKPLPFLLCQMNLLLHGLEAPQISKENSLAVNIKQLTDKDRVDVILTNPPFGGEEEASIKANFPEDKQTAETALLFLQLIMRKLRRTDSRHPQGGRAAVVVPNGTLFGDGVCARIKEEMLTQFNLHTIVRLPNGVFAPYTGIATNILFFDRSGPTDTIWYYEHPLPEGRKNYTKTQPVQYEEFAPLVAWWRDRQDSRQAWRVKASDVLRYEGDDAAKRIVSCNLDIKNPNTADDLEHMPAEQLVADIVRMQATITTEINGLAISTDVEETRPDQSSATETGTWPVVRLGEVITHRKQFVQIDDLTEYKRCRVQLHAQGIVLRDRVPGSEIKTKSQQLCRVGDFLVAEIDAKMGGFGIVPQALDGAIVSSHYFLFEVDDNRLDREFLRWYITTPSFREQVSAQGTTNYAAIRPAHVLNYTIPLPPLAQQRRIVAMLNSLEATTLKAEDIVVRLRALSSVLLNRALQGAS